jgi:hypothetical protein
MAPKVAFISHRGPDTKRSFSDLLCEKLVRRKLSRFLDEHSLELGNPAWPTIVEALTAAKVVVIVLSTNFYKSATCREERTRSGKRVACDQTTTKRSWPGPRSRFC